MKVPDTIDAPNSVIKIINLNELLRRDQISLEPYILLLDHCSEAAINVSSYNAL